MNHLTEDLQPSAAASQDILQDLTDLEAAVGAWERSGQASAVDDYRQSLARLLGHEQQARQFSREDAGIGVLITRQQDAADEWLDKYAEPRITAEGGPGTFDPKRFKFGQQRFAAFREAHQAAQEGLDRRVRQASADASFHFKGTIFAVLALAALAWLVLGRARLKLLRGLAVPLHDLESVVSKMAKNDPVARAEFTGPREMRAVAAVLNDFADGQGRARAVEGRIQDELRALGAAKDDFVSNVSHELRTPLTTISGYLELVAEEFDGQLAPRHERMLEATRRNVARLKALIDDLLALSKAENRAAEMEQTDATALLRDAVTDVRITAAGRGVAIEVTAPPEPMLVLADRVMLHRAFLNVVSNAVKFSRDQGTVEISLARQMSQVVIVVTDHGIGIPAVELDRLGTRFFRASNAVTNEIAGTGLGLRMVQTIVDRHAGDVLIESTEGAGTMVSIRLRLQDDHKDAETETPEGRSVS